MGASTSGALTASSSAAERQTVGVIEKALRKLPRCEKSEIARRFLCKSDAAIAQHAPPVPGGISPPLPSPRSDRGPLEAAVKGDERPAWRRALSARQGQRHVALGALSCTGRTQLIVGACPNRSRCLPASQSFAVACPPCGIKGGVQAEGANFRAEFRKMLTRALRKRASSEGRVPPAQRRCPS
jgi:hypothetical protein